MLAIKTPAFTWFRSKSPFHPRRPRRTHRMSTMPPTTASNSTSRRLPSGQNQPTTDDEVSESAEHQASRIPPRWCPAVACPESARRRHGVADTKPASAPFALRQTDTPHPPSGCELGAEIRSSGVAASAPYTRHCAEGRFPSRDRSSDRNEQHAAALVHHPATSDAQAARSDQASACIC